MKNSSLSYIELSQKNLIHNFKALKGIAKNTKIVGVIKGNAYGHGQNEVAKILEPYVEYFQVNSVEELKLLRKVTNKKTLILGYVQKENLKRVIQMRCILTVFSIEQIKHVSAMAEMCKSVQEIHIPVDAYLGREGFLLKELPKILQEIKKCNYIKLTGIYGHFANIEDTANFTHAQKQIDRYKEAVMLAKKFGFKNLQTHISATSGLLVYEKNKNINSVVRLGIGLYGMWPSENIKKMYRNKIELKPVLSWKSKVAQIKTLPKGSSVGYGLTYITKKETRIAVIPQGYADGLDRGLSNKGEVLIHGTRCKIIGRVSMNMFVADISHLSNVQPEDEVVIIGTQGKEKITAEEVAKKIDTINYEITTRISSLLPRIVV